MGHIEERVVVGYLFYGRAGSDRVQRNAYFLDYPPFLFGEMCDSNVIWFRREAVQ